MGFRFETILKLNKNKEDLLQKELGQINAFIQKKKDSQNFLNDMMGEKKEELNKKKREDINLQTMTLYDNFFCGIQLYNTRQDRIISEVNIKLEKKREEVINAMRKRRTLEILKDRELLKVKDLKQKKLLAIQDEITSNLWTRKH